VSSNVTRIGMDGRLGYRPEYEVMCFGRRECGDAAETSSGHSAVSHAFQNGNVEQRPA
jgi:hypothetical protein